MPLRREIADLELRREELLEEAGLDEESLQRLKEARPDHPCFRDGAATR